MIDKMNSKQINELVKKNIPSVEIQSHKNFLRHDCLQFLDKEDCIGIELGVAGGHYSKRIIESGKFKKFYGVDLYEDHHNVDEYISALKLIGLDKNYTLLRMSFDDAIELFDDNYFDFIYFDGYAHTGEEGGKTFSDWYRKLKIGGLFAGDDYHTDWPLVKWAVNDMVCKIGCKLNITGTVEDTNLNHYPTWFFTKKEEINFLPDKKLQELGIAIRNSTRIQSPDNFRITIPQLEEVLKQVKTKNPNAAAKLKALL
tara:strand:- start:1413 stop:2180 length:768 start_codon:yes stop_codon:yes gene_type:complete